MTERVFRYVPHDKRAEFEAAGWRHSADLAHHGAYSSLYERDEPEPEAGDFVQAVITRQRDRGRPCFKISLMSEKATVGVSFVDSKEEALESLARALDGLQII